MNCQRCKANEAEYLVYTDTINLKMCIFCAITAKEIGLKSSLDCDPIISRSLGHLN